MIFKKICIQNLFSYYGEQVFDFPPPTRKRPVILIAGRNGFGKTSFINSVKLLFLGTADEMLRNVQAGMTLRPNSYLLGTGKECREFSTGAHAMKAWRRSALTPATASP